MVKRIGRRFVSLLLTFVTILSLLPAMTLPALAATSGEVTGLSNTDIGLSFTGTAGKDEKDPWSASGAQITCSLTIPGGCHSQYQSTLTITNKKTTAATLSFDYTVTVSGGTIQVDGTTVNKGGSFSKELAAGGSIKVYIEAGDKTAATKITISNVNLLVDVTATVTFQPAEHGSYTVDGNPFTEEYTNTQSAATAYRLVATPYKGYRFIGWYDVTKGRYINANATASLNFDSDCTITARFGSEDLALFETNGLNFDNLSEAVTEAKKYPSATITLVSDGPLAGTYTIPNGVTLLIPFDEAKTCYTATPSPTPSQESAKAFRTLTMMTGSSITLESGAAISVGGQYYASSGGQKGKMAGPYGYIKMEDDSTITVESGANLYAWGFISGSGSVTVASGGSVYEWYQIMDFRGGDASTSMGNKVFPFNQYAVQNIEVPLTMHAGASETVQTALYALRNTHSASIAFIGDNGLFKLNSGSLTKAYDGKTDRMIYTIDGNAELKNLKLNLFLKFNIDSKDYVMPLTNNMTIDLNSGSKLTMNQTAALLPGVEVTIGRDAELIVSQDQSMYIYDVDEWGKYCSGGENNSKFIPVVYAPGRTGSRPPLEDVKVEVNGKLTANGGIYTTKGGADICSSGGGRYYQQGAPGKETVTYQYDGGPTKHDIPITAAKLHNFDGTYTETKDANVGKTFTYCTCAAHKGGEWVPDLQVAEIIDSNGTPTMGPYSTLQEAVKNYTPNSNTAPTNYIKLLHNTTENINTTKDIYLDLNGCTVTGDFTMKGKTLHGMDSSTGKDYVTAPSGKIVGKVTGTVAPVFEKPLTGDAEYNYLRYVAIKNEEGTEYTFHRFNISVTGYRFELTTGGTPQCALFFIGKFQGDDAAKAYLKSLGFKLKDINDKITNPRYEIPAGTKIPPESEPGDSPVVLSGDAYLFEAYLMHDIDKKNANTYTKKFSAIAQATFQNDETQNSEKKEWSFQEAWQNALTDSDMDISPAEKEILEKFLKDLNIPIPNPKTE